MSGGAYYITQLEMEESLGREATEQLMAKLGGTRIYVPEKLDADHRIVLMVGAELAAKFAAFVSTGKGGLVVEVPIGNTSRHVVQRRKLREMVERGDLSASKIALAMGVADRTVRRMRAKIRAEGSGLARTA